MAAKLKESARVMMLSVFFLALLSSAALSFTVPSGHPAQEPAAAGKQVVRMFAQNGNSWLYMCYLPPAYDSQPDKKWPTIMFITGGGGSSRNPWSNFMGDGPVNYLQNPSTCRYISDSFIVITPWADELLLWPSPVNSANYNAYLTPLFAHISSTYRVDPRRIHLDGYCFGGAVWFNYAAMHPNVPASISIWSVGNVGSTIYPDKACLLKDISIQWWQNRGDNFAPWQAAQAAVDSIKKCGGTKIDFHLGLVSGWHEIWRYGSEFDGVMVSDKTPAVYEWMLNQVNPSPATAVNPEQYQKASRLMKTPSNADVQPNSRVEIIGLNGKVIAGYAGNSSVMHQRLRNMSNGLHLVRVTSNDKSTVTRIIAK